MPAKKARGQASFALARRLFDYAETVEVDQASIVMLREAAIIIEDLQRENNALRHTVRARRTAASKSP